MADTNLLILAREFKNLRTHVQEVLKMPVGPQGLQGEKGEQGVKGDTGAPGKDGKDGKDGVNGLNGQDGRNGVDGNDGKDGLDGVGVQNAYIDFDNSLVIVLTSGQEINAGFLSQETKDAVVATFKQGAQTINELLPNQTGNAGKYLTTDGTNISWASIAGGLSYQGTWNASTNTPTLASGVGTNGYYYITATAGSTNLNGITDWQIGDWLMFNGTVWQKIDQSNLVTSVNGQTGAVSLDAADVGAEPADATILKDADIGVTVQGYSAVLAGTTASFTTADETKLDGIAAGAEVNVNADWNAVSGDAQILNKPTLYSDASVDTHLNTSTATSTQILSWTGTDYDWINQPGGSALTIQDEGSTLTSAATSLNFTGAGVTATNTGGAVTVAITGGGGGGISSADIQEFTTAGTSTWTKPAGAKIVYVLLFGGGGGGGSGRRRATASSATAAYGGGGGGAGGRAELWIPANALGQTETVTVGAGGTGAAAQTVDDNNGTSSSGAGNSSFGSWAQARSGSGGGGGSSTSSISGGSGGGGPDGITAGSSLYSANGAAGNTNIATPGSRGGYRGGGGGGGVGFVAGSTTANPAGAGGKGGSAFDASVSSSGGGGSAGPANGNGGNGSNATTYFVGGDGGGGGGSSTTTAGAGGNGGFPGGGGGGGGAGHGVNSGAGGNGGNGYVRIVTFF